MALSLFASAQINIPSTPLGVSMAAKPITLLVAGKDHRLFYEAYNDASDIDSDGTLDIRFKPNITYYGLFDPHLCYSHNNKSDNTGLFEPTSETSDGKCKNSSGRWSGNWLNYMTTSRIDALRKALYGGYREVDTPTKTILRRAYIPQDAHSWAKEYASIAVDGYDISDYTPLDPPSANKRHFFGNLTANASTNCATLSTCSDLPPLLSVVTNSQKRVWEWASKERPVLDNTHGGTRMDLTVRVKVCNGGFTRGCKQYPNNTWKPIGLLHEYGENEAMLFGLLSGSYNKNMSGGVLRKVISSFKNEVDQNTGQFTANAKIVQTFNALRIRDFNNNRTDRVYRRGWVATRAMNQGEFVDWGNPMAEMLYEGLRYLAGKKTPTSDFDTSGSYDQEVGLPVATWDDPYDPVNSQAKALWCSRPSIMAISDINVSFDSDKVPGSYFSSFAGDLTGLNVQAGADTITNNETGIIGQRFIGQSAAVYDSAPTAKTVGSLGTIRGLAPEEPTKEGSYYSASIAYFGKSTDLRSDLNKHQSTDTYAIVLASPLPRLEARLSSGSIITLVPFAKSVGGCMSTSSKKGDFQPTNQIVDLYVEEIANSGAGDSNPNINGGRYYAKFRINYEDVEQGADHDMDVIAEYTLTAKADNTLEVKVKTTYQAGCIYQNIGYIISGSNRDGIYLVAQDENVSIPYFLNVPPNRSPGYCDVTGTPPSDCNTLPCATGSSCAYPNESSRTFSPGASTATLLRDPLWYAAKWGGFIDKNNNNKPDQTYEWDADNNGVPDTYFLVQNPLKLKENLKRALENIIERTASSGSITANSTSLNSDTRVFRATFNTQYWSGELAAYAITSSGIANTASWEASKQSPLADNPSNRKIYITRSDGQTKRFLWSELTSAEQNAIGSENVLQYLRGVRTEEQPNGTLRTRQIDNVLGDIVHSAPFYVKDTDTVYIGANDGMLHAFNASSGAELFAYIPSALISKLKNLSQPGYKHDYYVDGEIAVSTLAQTMNNFLVMTLGRGGKGLFALDVTDPASFGPGNFKWSYFNTSDQTLGLMIGRPVIAKMNNGDWAVILGNGYNSTAGKAALYIFKLNDGSLLAKIDTGVAGDNGLATPGTFDADNDGDIDVIYAGDLKGNIWKFDVSTSNPNQWDSAFKQGSTPQPFFVARDSSNNPQPITAQITVAIDYLKGDPNFGKRFIFFGTGSYFHSDDPTNTQRQSWYGLIDEDTQISGRSELTQRSIEEEGTLSGSPVRTFADAQAGDMVGKKGWYLDFTTQAGERIVTASKLYRLIHPTLIASSIIPIDDPCVPGGKGYVNFINPFTGARLKIGVVDVNQSGGTDDDKLNDAFVGGFDLGVGMPGEAIVIGGDLVISGSGSGSGEEGTGEENPDIKRRKLIFGQAATGRVSWREIVTE
ncbi:pilus assembly protein [Caldichromatium japonicum]|nr:PilC/PilY family type IV pilus protein [Caldichromatium japonicum]